MPLGQASIILPLSPLEIGVLGVLDPDDPEFPPLDDED